MKTCKILSVILATWIKLSLSDEACSLRAGITISLTRQSSTGPFSIDALQLDLLQAAQKHGLHIDQLTIVDPAALLAEPTRTLESDQEETPGPTSTPVPQKRTSVALQLNQANIPGLYWTGSIAVGTPPQEFSVVFDTGSADLVLPGTGCIYSMCRDIRTYDPAKSTTSEDEDMRFSVTYADASARGKQYMDVVHIGELIATGQVLGAASEFRGNLGKDRFPADGILGLAFSILSRFDDDYSGVIHTMISQGQLEEPVFAFGVSNDLAGTAELAMGGVDTGRYRGEFTYSDVTDAKHWQIGLDAISVNEKTVISAASSIIDTGTFFVIGAPSDVAKIYASIPNAILHRTSGFWELPCKSDVNVTLTFAGKAWTVPRQMLILPRSTVREEGEFLHKDTCIGGIAQNDENRSGKRWVIGNVFLGGVYTVFDVGRKRVGFAELDEQAA